MLSQLIYVSVRTATCTEHEIEKILDSSNRNNGTKDITGVLLYSKNKFLQVLEGDHDLILSLYDHIKMDKRHTNVVMISIKPIESRYFPSWQMGSKKINTDSFDFLTHMDADSKKDFLDLLAGKDTNNAIRIIHKLFV